MNLKAFYKLMAMLWLLGCAAIAFSGCVRRDKQGQPTAESFSTTGFFQLRDGGDVVRGQ